MKPLKSKKYIWIGLIVVFLTFLIFLTVDNFISDTTFKDKKHFETIFLYYVGALIISTLVLILAYMQSQAALEQSKTNYLLKIDERWSSMEIIKAREVIHEFYLQTKAIFPNCTNHELIFYIGQNILKINSKNETEEISKFISLLNFLDFLETIGYMYYRQSLNIKDIQELFGNSIVYFYKVFEGYILYRREKDPKFYKMFEYLYIDLCKFCLNSQILDKKASLNCKDNLELK